MAVWIALLRGINVGGKHVLPMKDLKALLEELGCRQVKTYIQSGNVVLESDAAAGLGQSISKSIETQFGFAPSVLLLSVRQLKAAIKANPFPAAEALPKTLHLSFLAARPKAVDHSALDAIRAASESYALKGSVFYLHAPEGIARSKLAARAEKLLGVDATGRNWRTVTKLAELVAQVG